MMSRAGFSAEIAGDDYRRLYSAWLETGGVKGLVISGAFGCGKTVAAKAIYPNAWAVYCAERWSVDGVIEDIKERQPDGWDRDVILDDLGADTPRSDYGIIIDPLGEFIIKRHRDWQYWVASGADMTKRRGKTIITTNLTMDAILERYKERVFSRLSQMCVHVEMKGGDKRK